MEFLLEYKNIGPLYHIIDMEKLEFILTNDYLKPKHFFGGISTTRNKMMNGYTGDSPVSIFKLELDTGKLSYNYKIVPFSDTTTEIGYGGSRKTVHFDEREELIKTKKLNNISKYITKLIIIKRRVERLKDSGWFDSDGGNYKGQRMTIPEYFKKFIKDCKLPIYVQDGTKIIKDDKWVESIINYPIKQINHGYIFYRKEDRPHPKLKYGWQEIFVSLDKINNEMSDIVVGYEYENLYLFKDIEQIIPLKGQYTFDYEYELEDIIEENNKYIKVSKAKLAHIDKK